QDEIWVPVRKQVEEESIIIMDNVWRNEVQQCCDMCLITLAGAVGSVASGVIFIDYRSFAMATNIVGRLRRRHCSDIPEDFSTIESKFSRVAVGIESGRPVRKHNPCRLIYLTQQFGLKYNKNYMSLKRTQN
ncbi:hypothetical protein L9F63_016760, partial [Diploptera punctata]